MITAKLDLVPLFKKLRNTPALLHLFWLLALAARDSLRQFLTSCI